MSLFRLLPSLRTPVVQRSCAAAFSSSTCVRAAEPTDEAIQLLESYVGEQLSAPAQDAEAVDDKPPNAPTNSYPRRNPLTAAKANVGTTKPVYTVSVKSTRNNTLVTFARPGGNQLVTLTGGKLGFKKSNRNGYEAGYQCAVGIIGAMEKELQKTDYEWDLYLKGFGQGRDAMLTAITTAVGEKVKPRLRVVTDRTPLKIGGTRGQKTRRV